MVEYFLKVMVSAAITVFCEALTLRVASGILLAMVLYFVTTI